MSLICDETERVIESDEHIFVSTRADVDSFSALSKEIILRIPESEKRDTVCGSDEDGINIYTGLAEAKPNGTYLLSSFRIGEFLFSISEKTAQRLFPNHYRKRYLK